MELFNVVEDEFNDIAQKYSLCIKELSENETIIYSNDFILSFEIHASELSLSYIEMTQDGRMIQYYNIGSFIAYLASSDVRDEVSLMEISNMEKQIKIYHITIKNNFEDLFANSKAWLNDYKKFFLSVSPRDVTEIKKIYKTLT